MRLASSPRADALTMVAAAAVMLAAGACADRSVGSITRDGGRDASSDLPTMGDATGSEAQGVMCGAGACSPGLVCCTGCDGTKSCGEACPGFACPLFDGGSDGAARPDGGGNPCTQAGGICTCVVAPPPGYQPAAEPLRSTCPQGPPGSGACAEGCAIPIPPGACTDRGAACPSGMVCDLNVTGRCFASTAGGSCIVRPTSCPPGGDAVCGCDGKTYNNDCFRQLAGIQLDHKGACVPAATCGASSCTSGQSCCSDCVGNKFCEAGACSAVPSPCLTCRGSATCPSGSYCATSAAGDFRTRCNPMGSGYCAPRPGTCTAPIAPVCGCDGKTYDNDCRRRMAGVNLDHVGACP